jgi:hypothetical protein
VPLLEGIDKIVAVLRNPEIGSIGYWIKVKCIQVGDFNAVAGRSQYVNGALFIADANDLTSG